MIARNARAACRRTLLITLCCLVAGAQAAGSVTLLTQERSVAADATSGPPDADAFTSTAPGPFADVVTAYSAQTVCLPFGGKCVTYSARGSAEQSSLVTTGRDGALEIRARGSASANVNFTGEAHAASHLSAEFVVDGEIDYVLQAEGSGNSAVVLESTTGVLVDADDLSAAAVRAGRLAPGTYTLRVAAEAVIASPSDYIRAADFDLRFSASTVRPGDVACTIRLDSPVYEAGQHVMTDSLRLANDGAQAVPVELKIWLTLPDGTRIAGRNDGADGSVSIPAETAEDYAPFEVLAVGADTPTGLYKLGCRVLDPLSGRPLAEDSDLFEVR